MTTDHRPAWRPQAVRGHRSVRRSRPAARHEDAAFRRRAARHRAGGAPGRAVPRHRAGARAAEERASLRDRRRFAGRRAGLYLYRLTDAGHVRAALFLEDNHYVGALPVPLEQYQAYMARFAEQHSVEVTRELVQRGVLAPGAESTGARSARSRDRGVALAVHLRPAGKRQDRHRAGDSQHPAGRDRDPPRASTVEGHIIRVFDPVNHERVTDDDGDPGWKTTIRSITAGCAAGGRSSPSAAS